MFKYFKPYLFRGFLAGLFKMGESIADLTLPFFMAKIIDIGVANHDKRYMFHIFLIMLIISILGYTSSIISNYLSCHTSQSFGSNLRESMFKIIQKYKFEDLSKFTESSLITRMTKDVNQITNMFLMCIRMVLRGLTTGVGAVVMAIIINPTLSIIFLIISPVIIFLTTYYVKKSFNLYEVVQNKMDELTMILRENLTGIRVVRALGKEKVEEKKFNRNSDELKDDTVIADSVMLSKLPFITLVMNLGIVAVLWFGGLKVHYGNLQVGEVVAFINYLNMVLFSMNALSFLFSLYSRTSVSYRRVKEVLDYHELPKSYVEPIATDNSIIFDNVSFAYKKHNVLENLNFNIKKGEHIGIIGSIGSGKTTLVALMDRFYHATKGVIFIDGRDINSYSDEALRKKIGIVLQKTFLFSGSVEENIKWGDENAAMDNVRKIAKMSQAHDFIENLEKGYKTVVKKGATNLSGGQKQRISIARTLLTRPEIFIFDDSFSAIDSITEYHLKENLKDYIKDKTTIIVASKVKTIIDMDKIMVLDSGRIVGYDTHTNLLKNCTVYREICESQEVGENSERDI